MDFKLTKEKPEKLSCDLFAIGCFEEEADKKSKEIPAKLMKADGGIALDRALDGEISRAIKAGTFTGEAGKVKVLYTEGRLPTRHVALVGLGKKKEANLDTLRSSMAKVAATADEFKLTSIGFVLESKTLLKSAPPARLQALVEGTILGRYSFEIYKDKEKRAQKTLKTAYVITERQNAAIKNALNDGQVIADATILARDLGNTPGNDLTPRMLAKFARDVATKGKLAYHELDPAQMQKEKMNAFLSVAQGSHEPPAFAHITYKPKGRSRASVAIVGKGVTFDAGGISIKPSRGMWEMKADMGGAAAVIATMKAIAQLKPRVTVDAYICAAENMPDGKAIKPGDIVTARNGKTIEYISTDAEGRMLLADGLHYACDKKPDYVIDICTLTGACPYAVGEKYAAVLGTDQKFVNLLIKAGEQAGDPLWQLPLEKSYAKGLTTTIADLKNTGSSKADTINGALFLLNFVGETPWAHLDIASNAWTEEATPLCPKGATGSGVRLLTQFLMNLQGKSKDPKKERNSFCHPPIPRTMRSIYKPQYLDAYSRIRHGQLLCARCVELAVAINDIHLESRGHTLPARQSAKLAEGLSSFTSTEADDALRTGFLRHLNTVFNKLFMKLVDFESSLDLANSINRGSHPAFATIHGDCGVIDIAEIENADPPIALPHNTFSQSPILMDTPIGILPQADNAMPNLLLLPREGMFDPFLTGNLRTGYALAWALRTFLNMNEPDTDKPTLIEYGPRLSIGTMALAARMGIDVFWKETEPQAWVHTMHQLARLPKSIRSRISFIPAGEYRKTSIAVWNMPWPSIGNYRLGADLVSYGLLLFQSEQLRSAPPHSWRVRAAIDLPRGEYIFPSSYEHIQPRTFQVWQNFSR